MEELESTNVIVATIYVIAGIVSQISFHATRSYHENKPLGMQTFLSKVVVLFVQVTQGSTLIVTLTLIFGELHGRFNDMLAFSFAITEYIVTLIFYSSLLMVTLTKYLLIYNSAFMSDVNELKVMKYLKGFLILFPLIMASVEFTFWTKIEQTEAFKMFHSGKEQLPTSFGYGKIILVLCNFAAAILLQVRIELDVYNRPNHENLGLITKLKSCFATTQPHHGEEYKLNVARIVFAIAFVLGVFFLVQVLFQVVTFRLAILFFYVLLGDICPLIFIFNHPSMRSHFIKTIYVWLSCAC